MRYLPGGVDEEPGLTQPTRKGLRSDRRRRGRDQPTERLVTAESCEVQFIVAADAKGYNLMRRACDLAAPGHFTAIVPERPDASGQVIAINIGAGQFGQPGAYIKPAAGDARRLRMRVSDDGRDDRAGAWHRVRFHGLRAFGDRPTVITAAFNAVDHFPHFPTDIARPEVGGAGAEGNLPRVPQSIGPDLAAGSRGADKRVVTRNSIRETGIPAVDVDPQDGGFEIVDGLAGFVGVRRRGGTRVAGRDVKHLVRAEKDIAAIVPGAGKRHDSFRGGGIDPRHVPGHHFEAQHTGPIGRVVHPGTDEDFLGLGKARVEGEAVDLEFGGRGMKGGEVGEKLGARLRLTRIEGPDFSPALGDKQACAIRTSDDIDRRFEDDARKNRGGLIRRRRFRRADQSRRGLRIPNCRSGRGSERGKASDDGKEKSDEETFHQRRQRGKSRALVRPNNDGKFGDWWTAAVGGASIAMIKGFLAVSGEH